MGVLGDSSSEPAVHNRHSRRQLKVEVLGVTEERCRNRVLRVFYPVEQEFLPAHLATFNVILIHSALPYPQGTV
jgi:hypothetical protein